MTEALPIALGDLLREARRGLVAAPFEVELREAGHLLARVLGRSEAGVLAHPEEPVPAHTAARFRELVARRIAGEPMAYLLGEREFYGRPFRVDSRVLIPRPETEHLIEAALALELPAAPRIIDVGTGSGAIAITLALEIPDARLLATDMSLAALRVAAANVRAHGLSDRVSLMRADLLRALRLSVFDLVVSNPPYVDRLEEASLSIEVTHFEPHLALFAPGAGHSVVERLLDEGRALRPETPLILEIGYDQSEWLEGEVERLPEWRLANLIRDYAAIPRTAVLQRQRV